MPKLNKHVDTRAYDINGWSKQLEAYQSKHAKLARFTSISRSKEQLAMQMLRILNNNKLSPASKAEKIYDLKVNSLAYIKHFNPLYDITRADADTITLNKIADYVIRNLLQSHRVPAAQAAARPAETNLDFVSDAEALDELNPTHPQAITGSPAESISDAFEVKNAEPLPELAGINEFEVNDAEPLEELASLAPLNVADAEPLDELADMAPLSINDAEALPELSVKMTEEYLQQKLLTQLDSIVTQSNAKQVIRQLNIISASFFMHANNVHAKPESDKNPSLSAQSWLFNEMDKAITNDLKQGLDKPDLATEKVKKWLYILRSAIKQGNRNLAILIYLKLEDMQSAKATIEKSIRPYQSACENLNKAKRQVYDNTMKMVKNWAFNKDRAIKSDKEGNVMVPYTGHYASRYITESEIIKDSKMIRGSIPLAIAMDSAVNHVIQIITDNRVSMKNDVAEQKAAIDKCYQLNKGFYQRLKIDEKLAKSFIERVMIVGEPIKDQASLIKVMVLSIQNYFSAQGSINNLHKHFNKMQQHAIGYLNKWQNKYLGLVKQIKNYAETYAQASTAVDVKKREFTQLLIKILDQPGVASTEALRSLVLGKSGDVQHKHKTLFKFQDPTIIRLAKQVLSCADMINLHADSHRLAAEYVDNKQQAAVIKLDAAKAGNASRVATAKPSLAKPVETMTTEQEEQQLLQLIAELEQPIVAVAKANMHVTFQPAVATSPANVEDLVNKKSLS